MLGDYSEFEILCNVLECNELVKYLFGICLMMFLLVSHSSCARHLTKLPSRYLEGSLRLKICPQTCRMILDYPGCFAFPSMKTAKNVDGRPQKQVPSMKRAVFVDGLSSDLLLHRLGHCDDWSDHSRRLQLLSEADGFQVCHSSVLLLLQEYRGIHIPGSPSCNI